MGFDFSGGGGGGFGSGGGITIQPPPISVGGNSALPGSTAATNPMSQFSQLLPLLMILGMAGAFPTTIDKTGTSDSTTTGGTTLDTLMKTLLETSQQSSGTTGTTPTLSPATQAFMDSLMGKYNAQSAPSLTGYEAQQTGNINTAAGAQEQAVNNIMAARGLSTSPAAATAQAGLEQNRLNQITSMQQGLPLLKNQLDLQNLAGASAFFSAIPKGSMTTTSQQQTGTSTGQQTGSQVGTNTSRTQGTTTEKGTSGGGLGGAAQGVGAGVGAILPWLLKQMGIPAATTTTPNNADSVPHA